MHYQIEKEIDLARDVIIEKFNNSEYLKHYQQDLISGGNLRVTSGENNAKTLLKYKMGRQTFEMIETISKNSFPDSLHSTLETKRVFDK
jgi:hypothetical protein